MDTVQRRLREILPEPLRSPHRWQQAQHYAFPVAPREAIHPAENKRQARHFSAKERNTSYIQLLNFRYEESITGEHCFDFPPSYQADFHRCAYDFQNLK